MNREEEMFEGRWYAHGPMRNTPVKGGDRKIVRKSSLSRDKFKTMRIGFLVISMLLVAIEGIKACECQLYNSALFPNFPVKRDGSGTSWLPDSSPVHAIFSRRGPWDVKVHGNLFLVYTNQDVADAGTRGAERVYSNDWFMGSASRYLGEKSKVVFRGMLSLSPFTVEGRGYPLLFQTGETWNERRLVDRQHPHDLIGELSVALSHSVSDEDTFFLYLGYPGEPALGPPSYLHRPSAQSNPVTPLGHHWQDSTHITFGVATLGWRSNNYKMEVSAFTGREPNEHRLDLDKPKFDSFSIRHSVNPMRDLAIQGSIGFIKSPESAEPKANETRANLSVIYNIKIAEKKYWATTVSYGGNAHLTRIPRPHTEFARAFLLESELEMPAYSLFTRLEYVEKFARQLTVPTTDPSRLFVTRSYSLGGTKPILTRRNFNLAAGLQGTVYKVDQDLEPLYGSWPYSLNVFLKYNLGRK